MIHLILITIFLFIADLILMAGLIKALYNEKHYKNWKKNFYSLTKNKPNAHN